jgi:MFS family permease
MLKKIIHSVLLRRHFWRHATFSEIAELYASRLLRTMALNIAASFMSIFLYQQGFSIPAIALFWAVFYLFKAAIALPAAALAAHIGAKHGILISNILYIPAMIIFSLVPVYGTWLLALVVILQGGSAALYSISYSTDFSKVKSVNHAGKEIAYMNIIEKVTAGLSPLIGGLLALLLGPQVVLVIASVLFAVAAVPLLQTGEQELPRQKLDFKGFPWHLIRPNIGAQAAIWFDAFTSGTVWSLFTAVFIIGVAVTNEVYAINGALVSVVLFAALGASYAYGRLIDSKRGGDLLKFASIGNALTHLMRPFATTPIMIAGLNIANEAATTGYTMAYTRGQFDNADLSGKRTTYLGIIEVIGNLGGAAAALILVLLCSIFSHQFAVQTLFFIAAAVALLVMTARFPLYRKKSS